jgi:hypothetical protein
MYSSKSDGNTKSSKYNVLCAKNIRSSKWIHCMRTCSRWQSTSEEASKGTNLVRNSQYRW